MGDGNERNVKRTGRPFSWRYLLLLTFQRTWALEPTRVTTRHKYNPSPGINGPSASHDRNDHICRSRHSRRYQKCDNVRPTVRRWMQITLQNVTPCCLTGISDALSLRSESARTPEWPWRIDRGWRVAQKIGHAALSTGHPQ